VRVRVRVCVWTYPIKVLPGLCPLSH